MENKSSKAIRREFNELMDKCQHSFARLRDLPPVGRQSWEPCFQEAFNVFSRLWKFQQEHRAALTAEGLKRWEIGEIASKIGQLYYNYYLRTSDTHFLQESYMFYEAIHARQYFQQALNDPTVTTKQLRYCVRFIIVCLLFNLREEVWQLVQELEAHVRTYIMKFQGADTREWQLVMDEVTSFLHADVALPPPRTAASMAPIQLRLRCNAGSAESAITAHKPCLREAIISCYYPRQVKIAELPLDSFRMLQVLEWEPVKGPSSTPPDYSDTITNSLSARTSNPTNPTKLIFHKATAPQLLSALAAVCAQPLPPDNLILVYISGLSPAAVAEQVAAERAVGLGGVENGLGGAKLRGLGVAARASGPAAGLTEELRRLKLSQGGDKSQGRGLNGGVNSSIPEDASETAGGHRPQGGLSAGAHAASVATDTQEEENNFQDDDDDEDVFGMDGADGEDMQPTSSRQGESRDDDDDGQGSRPGPARVLFPVQSLLELQAAGEQNAGLPPATTAGGVPPATLAAHSDTTSAHAAEASVRPAHGTAADTVARAPSTAFSSLESLPVGHTQSNVQGVSNVEGVSKLEGASDIQGVSNVQGVSDAKGSSVSDALTSTSSTLDTAPSENVPQVRVPLGKANGVGGWGSTKREVVPGTSWEETASKAGSSFEGSNGKLPGSWEGTKPAGANGVASVGGNVTTSALSAAGQGAVYLSGRRGYPTSECLLFPEDLVPFTRRPMFLVVDSDASAAFKKLQGKEHVSPLLCILSPPQHPASIVDPSVSGRLLTMFLSVPSMALCVLCRTHSPSVQKLQGLQQALDEVMKLWGSQLAQALITERSPWVHAFRDVLLRRIILRFVLCRAALASHKEIGHNPDCIPSCFPDLPACADPPSPLIAKGVETLTEALGMRQLFADRD